VGKVRNAKLFPYGVIGVAHRQAIIEEVSDNENMQLHVSNYTEKEKEKGITPKENKMQLLVCL
jgi:hypothetical protein